MLNKGRYLSIFILCFIAISIKAQNKQDSIEIAYEDSISRIPIELSTFNHYNFSNKKILPVNDYIVIPFDYFGLYKTPNYGSPVAFERNFIPAYKEYNLGFHSNDIYRRDIDQFTYIDCNKPYTETHTSQGRAFLNSQSKIVDNLNVNALFASRYQKNIHMLLRYDRINQKGLYAHDRNRVSSFQGGIHHYSKDNKFNISLNFVGNTIYNEHSNGIVTDTVLGYSNFQVRESVSLYSYTANTLIKDEQYGIFAAYTFKTLAKLAQPKIEFSSAYKKTKNYFTDENPLTSDTIYKTVPQDSDYLHRWYDQYNWINTIGLNLSLVEKLALRTKINHQYCHQYFDTFGIYPNRLSLEIGGIYQWKKNIHLDYTFYSDNDRQISNVLTLKIQKAGFADAEFHFFQQQQLTDKALQLLVVNKKQVWQNTFDLQKFGGIRFYIKPSLKYIPSLEYNNYQLKNFVYLNENAKVEQLSTALIIQHLTLNSYLKWRSIAIENKFYFTHVNPDKVKWNSWSSSHSLFLERKIIKKIVDSKIGLNVINHQPKYQSRYDPLTALYFHYSGDPSPEYALQYNAFLYFRVNDFTFTLDLENIESFFHKKPGSLVFHSPIYDFYLRFGIRWRFTY